MNENIYKEKDIANFHIPRWNELPDIDLYLDQIVTLLDKYLTPYIEKNKDDDSILTKTMINNYVKQGIIKAPIKKKYSREHIAYLFVLCILKQVYSITDISYLITLALKSTDMQTSYNKFCDALEKAISLTFAGKKYIDEDEVTSARYILKNVALSFACKLYVERSYLTINRIEEIKDEKDIKSIKKS